MLQVQQDKTRRDKTRQDETRRYGEAKQDQHEQTSKTQNEGWMCLNYHLTTKKQGQEQPWTEKPKASYTHSSVTWRLNEKRREGGKVREDKTKQEKRIEENRRGEKKREEKEEKAKFPWITYYLTVRRKTRPRKTWTQNVKTNYIPVWITPSMQPFQFRVSADPGLSLTTDTARNDMSYRKFLTLFLFWLFLA